LSLVYVVESLEIAIASFIFAAFLAGLSATLPPGPIFAMTVTESAGRGFLGGLMVVVGHALVEALVLIALTLGLGAFLASDSVRISISILGGFFLVWMGQGLVRDAYRGDISIRGRSSTETKAIRNPLLCGVLAAVANPYFLIWWAVVGGAFVLRGMELLGLLGPITFLICHWLSDFPWFSFVSFFVGRGRDYFSNTMFRGIIAICGVFLLVLGASFMVEGARFIVERAQ